MYATTSDDIEIMIAIHGPFPFLALTEGRSLNQADNDIRKLNQAICWVLTDTQWWNNL